MSMFALVERVEVAAARTFAAAASAGATTLTVDDGTVFATSGTTGQLVLATGEVCDYSAWDATTVTLVDPLPVDVADNDPIEVYPERSVKTAYVDIAPDDEFSDTVPARVPHGARAYTRLAEGTYEGADRPQVQIELSGGTYVVVDGDALNQNPGWDAATGPVHVSNAEGESATVNAVGFSTTTNDPVPVRTIVTPAGRHFTALDYSVVVLDGFAYVTSNEIDGDDARIDKYDLSTGERVVGGGWPIATPSFGLAAGGGFLYSINPASLEVEKWNADTGAAVVGGGFPIDVSTNGVSGPIIVSGVNLFLIDSLDNVRSYVLSTGAARAGNFPLATTAGLGLSAATGGAFNLIDGDDIDRFDADGVAVGAPFPIIDPGNPGTPLLAASGGGKVLVVTDLTSDVIACDETDGSVLASSGWPLSPNALTTYALWADDQYLVAAVGYDATLGVATALRVFNNSGAFESTRTSSADGTSRTQRVITGDVEAAGDLSVEGRTDLSDQTYIDGQRHDAVLTTKMSRAAAQNAATGTPTTPNYDDFEGSGTSGATDCWSESAGVVTIHKTGVYEIAAVPTVAANSSGGRRVQLIINGVVVLDRFDTTGMSPSVSWRFPLNTGKVALAKDSTIEMRITQTSGVTLSLVGTWLSVTRAGVLAA